MRMRPEPDGGRERFAQETGVSRETLHRFDLYAELLGRWQRAVNLVAPSTLDQVWLRHFLDSAQLRPLCPESTRTLVDLGSGAGFPGLVLALLGIPEVHLVESDQRKAAFLREVAHRTGTPITLHTQRIESIQPFAADVVTARGLASLSQILAYARPFLGPGGVCLCPKGARAYQELTEASELWHISVADTIQSKSDPTGTILRLRGIAPALGSAP